MQTAAEFVEKLDLTPHPEGGYFRETYRSANIITPDALTNSDYNQPKHHYTSIYYLLGGHDRSRFHRLVADEILHHHYGSDVTVHQLSPEKGYHTAEMGLNACCFQLRVPAGTWFAITVNDNTHFALLGCSVAPAFDFEDLEFADIAALSAEYPQQSALISALG